MFNIAGNKYRLIVAFAYRMQIAYTLIEAYERKHYPIDSPDPVEAIKFRMDQAGLSIKDLEPMIGQSNRVYEVNSHKRPLTLRMIRNLNKGLGISAQVLINDTTNQNIKFAVGVSTATNI